MLKVELDMTGVPEAQPQELPPDNNTIPFDPCVDPYFMVQDPSYQGMNGYCLTEVADADLSSQFNHWTSSDLHLL